MNMRRDRVTSMTRPVILLVALTTGACASARSVLPGWEPEQAEPITLTVENQNYSDATIYAWWGGNRIRLGLATGSTTQTFESDWRGGQLMVQVDFIGGGQYLIETFGVFEGDHLQLTIPPASVSSRMWII